PKAPPPGQAVLHLFCAGRRSRPASAAEREGRQIQGEIRSRLGPPAGDHARKSEEARSRSEKYEAHAAPRLDSLLGLTLGGRETTLRAHAGGFRRLPRACRRADRQ